MLCNKTSHGSEKPVYHNERVAPTCCNWRKSPCSNEDPAQSTINKFLKNLRIYKNCIEATISSKQDKKQNFLVEKFQNLYSLQVLESCSDSFIQFMSCMPFNMQRFLSNIFFQIRSPWARVKCLRLVYTPSPHSKSFFFFNPSLQRHTSVLSLISYLIT